MVAVYLPHPQSPFQGYKALLATQLRADLDLFPMELTVRIEAKMGGEARPPGSGVGLMQCLRPMDRWRVVS